ncbi:MAG: hypothetical protein NXH95_14175 [Pseudomonadaceae bacterium]|nr:hypothetical protein [Pseudomonadaceae bacterium]
MASIRENGSKYEARFSVTINGQTARRSVALDYKPTKAAHKTVEKLCNDADRMLALGESWEVVKAWLTGSDVTAPETLGFWFQHYIDVIAPEVDGVADSTLDGYESLYNSHWITFDNRPITSLTLEDMQRHLLPKKVSKKTKREAVSVLNRICRPAGVKTFEDWKIKKSKKDAQPEPDPYTAAERDLLLPKLRPWPIAYAYFLTGFYTGMRTSELLGLHWSDYDGTGFNVWQAMVRRKMQSHTKTKRRYVIVPQVIRSLLNEYPTRFEGGLIFKTPEGHMFKDADWLMDKWNRAHKTANVRRRLGLYPWRHTYISLALQGGMNINDVAVQSGNSRSVIEKHYAKWIPNAGDIARLLAQIEEAQK